MFKEEVTQYCPMCEEWANKYDQLKAENEELKKKNNYLERRIKGEIHLGNGYKKDFAEQVVRAETYKQALQEINEAIIKFAKEDILTFPDRKPEENYKFIQEQCAEPIRQILQILQKCEVIDEQN